MIGTLLALIGKGIAVVTGASPRLVELVGATAVTVGVTMWHGAAGGCVAAGVALLLKAWTDDVDAARAARGETRSNR